MLFNATQGRRAAVAIVDGQKLIDLDIESAGKEQRKSNIYQGVITRIEPASRPLSSITVNERHGFPPSRKSPAPISARCRRVRGRIQDALKNARKSSSMWTRMNRQQRRRADHLISLAGRYLVLMPNNPRAAASRAASRAKIRAELRTVSQLDVPQA